MLEGRERLFGTDLRLADQAGGMDLAARTGGAAGPGAAAGDLDLAGGNDNLVQALTLRLRVRQGELAPLGWPAYGSRLHELIGEPNVARTHLRLQAFARQAVEADPRVVRVEDARTAVLAGERDTVRLLLEVRVIDAPDPLNLVFDFPLEQP
jgi:phage baseplate assembly protein W